MTFRNWYPCRSHEIKDLFDHLTDDEGPELARVTGELGKDYGRRVGLFVAAPTSVLTVTGIQFGWNWPIIAAIFFGFSIAGALILRWVRRHELAEHAQWMRGFLCNTQWARAQGGYAPETLKLYRWPWQGRGRRETWSSGL